MTYDFLVYIAILFVVYISFRLKRTCNIFASLICEISDTLSSMIKKDNTCNAIKQTLQDTSYISFYIGMICGSLLEVVIF